MEEQAELKRLREALTVALEALDYYSSSAYDHTRDKAHRAKRKIQELMTPPDQSQTS